MTTHLIRIGPDIIAQEYERFAKSNLPAGAGVGQQTDMQRAFYAGVTTMMLVGEALAEVDDIAALLILEQIRVEALSFAASTVAIWEAQHHD
ncbi:hypothetical protein B0G84_3305 [Paraburkholderia sp. BL8N3]|nr:hypothetical protein [Paraburkholderia sp. BL8N3]TCK38002.1 hypothetical protein B0G84_3305 [Paraburkholderia sp. BL8N3]